MAFLVELDVKSRFLFDAKLLLMPAVGSKLLVMADHSPGGRFWRLLLLLMMLHMLGVDASLLDGLKKSSFSHTLDGFWPQSTLFSPVRSLHQNPL